MSASRIFLRRVGRLLDHHVDRVGRERGAQRGFRFAAEAPAGRSRSQAMSSASQRVSLAPTARAALCARLGRKDAVLRAGNERGDKRHERERIACEGGIVRDAILIAGPTASGKSAMALDLAEREGGVIVNANSMQVYSVLERAHGAADGR